jgi:hypothetical protein
VQAELVPGALGRLRKGAEEIEPLREVRDRLRVRGALQGPLSRMEVMVNGAGMVVPALEMDRELRGDLGAALAVAGLLAGADREMRSCPPVRAQTIVEHALVERMAKPVASAHRSIRPRRETPVFDELPLPCQLFATRLGVLRRDPASRAQARHGEFHPRDAGDLQHLPFAFRQSSDLHLDQLSQPVRDRRLGRFRRTRSDLGLRTSLREIVRHLHHEERCPSVRR